MEQRVSERVSEIDTNCILSVWDLAGQGMSKQMRAVRADCLEE